MKNINRSEIMKRRWKDPAFRARVSRKAKLNWKKGITAVSFKGQKHDKSTKEKMSRKRKKYFEKPEHRENMRKKNLGKKQSIEICRKKGESMKKVWQDEKWAAKRIAGIRRTARSPEMRAKMARISRGRVQSEYTKRLVAEKIKAKWQTEEYRNKMLEANRTKKMRKIRSKNSSGENNPMYGKKGEFASNWRGGISRDPYAFEFNNELKEAIKERDRYVCQNCGNKKRLHVHHIDYDKKNSDATNLITLCNVCHAKTNFGRDRWIGKFREMVANIYG